MQVHHLCCAGEAKSNNVPREGDIVIHVHHGDQSPPRTRPLPSEVVLAQHQGRHLSCACLLFMTTGKAAVVTIAEGEVWGRHTSSLVRNEAKSRDLEASRPPQFKWHQIQEDSHLFYSGDPKLSTQKTGFILFCFV